MNITKKVISIKYKDYPNQPYISLSRDLSKWESNPELFPYNIVERSQMIKLEEGIFPGDIIILWRIGFDNFTNMSVIPQCFEYRYGINSNDSVERLLKLKYAILCNATDSLVELTSLQLKNILKLKHLKVSGKKQELLDLIVDNFKEDELKNLFELRKYKITNSGKELLNTYSSIIKKHGIKKG